MATRWTPATDDMLRRLWYEGKYIKNIAAILNFSKTTIEEKRRKLGLTSRFKTQTLGPHGHSVTLYLDAETYQAGQALAARNGLSLGSYVQGLIRRAGE